jgi:glutamate-1-semialdehyde 2,1-aminomutase
MTQRIIKEASMVSVQGPALWEKAKRIIPGGGQLLSKRSEKFLPGLWPAYYAKAKGCEVWDLDGNHFYDFAQMGVGSCVLGYADDDVNAAVIAAVQNGSMCSLNCPEEIELAEKLIHLHPWSEMIRFARTGGEACAIAVRIARAASGRSKVAFCGYHGWHDWYLSANLGNTANLDGQLLPGLEPRGVPRELLGTALPFNYNRLDELEAIVSSHPGEIGVIIMEPERGTPPEPGFLEGVRDIATRIGAVLVFDEVTSGFRVNMGGIHLTLGINPDLAVFGKALGNGFPISAVVGRREVMEHAQDTFISSTFWTERIGFTAALATIKKMEDHDVPKYLVRYGNLINATWTKLAQKNGIHIHISGIPPLTHIAFKTDDPLAIQTLYTQEMLERGFLLGAAVYTTYAYSDSVIDQFHEQSDAVFRMIGDAIASGNVKKLLKGEIVHAGFRRLTS